jgi:Fic family protein
MPARHQRAEKKKSLKRKDKKAKNRSSKRGKALTKKVGKARALRKPQQNVRGAKKQKSIQAKKTNVNTSTKPKVSDPKAAKPAARGLQNTGANKAAPPPPGKATPGKAARAPGSAGAPESKATVGAGKSTGAVVDPASRSKPGQAIPPAGKSVSAKAGAGAKPSKPKESRRSTIRPAPPLKPYKFIGVPSFTGPKPAKYTIPPPPPLPPPPPPASLEERVALVQSRLGKQDEGFRNRYLESFDMSWIYHDSALEGVVYSFQELKTAIDSSATVVQDSSLQPVCEDIRRHKQAIEFVRDFAIKKRLPVTLDVIKRIYLILHPEEGDLKTLKYRKDIPQHRLYFHEYAAPDKIAYKIRQIVDWINDPETKRGRNALRIAARAHYDLVRVFPFAHDSGKVARLLMNMLLMRASYEPAIIHSTERQRYYEALKGSAAVILHMVQEAEENGLASIEKLLEEHETKTRSFVS